MKQNIGLSIKTARNLKNLTQEDLSKKINIAVSNLSKIENDKVNPSIDTLTNISKALGMPIGFILTLGLTDKSFPRKVRVKYNLTKNTIKNIVEEIFKI